MKSIAFRRYMKFKKWPKKTAGRKSCNAMQIAVRRTANKNKRKRVGIYIIILTILTGIGMAYTALDYALEPVLYGIAQVRIKELISDSINDAVADYLQTNDSKKEFLELSRDAGGDISMVNANTVYMNEFSAGITGMIHRELAELEGEKVEIKVGSILGSNILSQIGPSVPLTIGALGNAKVNLFTEFESAGINQTKYKVYMKVTGETKPIIPFVNETVSIDTVVLVAETVIIGDVPQTYVTLPLTGN